MVDAEGTYKTKRAEAARLTVLVQYHRNLCYGLGFRI
jgi:hypothetical protein